MPNPLLQQRAVLFSKIEATYNTDPVPAATDAMLIGSPDFSVNLSVLSRNFTRFSLSELPHRMGRKLAGMKFDVEWRGSGNPATSPKIGKHLRAAGYAETQITTGAPQVGAVKTDPVQVQGVAVTWGAAGMGASSPPEPILYRIDVTTGGASGVAQVSITPDANAVLQGYDTAQTAIVITSATALQLKTGGTGGTITPTWAGNLTLGQRWWVFVYPVGWLYTPISTAFESVTNYLYWDGVLHKLTGGRATFTMDATAGQLPTAVFTYTGQWVAPMDTPLPTNGVYESTLPPQVELANLTIDEYQAVIDKFSFDQGNTISPRSDVSHSDGYNGVNITARAMKGGIDPEMTLVGNEDFWGRMAGSNQMYLRTRFGNVAGNRSWFLAPAVQYSGLTYQGRNSSLVLNAGLNFPQWITGDDEVQIFFG